MWEMGQVKATSSSLLPSLTLSDPQAKVTMISTQKVDISEIHTCTTRSRNRNSKVDCILYRRALPMKQICFRIACHWQIRNFKTQWITLYDSKHRQALLKAMVLISAMILPTCVSLTVDMVALATVAKTLTLSISSRISQMTMMVHP